ncbi:hypothetical protein MRX96_042936 [Rhipicephalus microplus]
MSAYCVRDGDGPACRSIRSKPPGCRRDEVPRKMRCNEAVGARAQSTAEMAALSDGRRDCAELCLPLRKEIIVEARELQTLSRSLVWTRFLRAPRNACCPKTPLRASILYKAAPSFCNIWVFLCLHPTAAIRAGVVGAVTYNHCILQFKR